MKSFLAVVFLIGFSLSASIPGSSLEDPLQDNMPGMPVPGMDPFQTVEATLTGWREDPGLSSAQDGSLNIQQAQLGLARDILALMDDGEAGQQEALEMARLALENREALLEDQGADRVLDGLGQQHRNLDLVESTLASTSSAEGIGPVVDIVYETSLWQASTFGWTEPGPPSAFGPPSGTVTQAITALADRHEVEIPAGQMERLESLDDLPQPLQQSLAALLEAFLVLDEETAAALDAAELSAVDDKVEDLLTWLDSVQADPDQAEASLGDPGPLTRPAEHMHAIGLDFSAVLEARLTFLTTLMAFKDTLEDADPGALQNGGPVDIPGVAAISLSDSDNTYTQDYRFQFDAGGNDTYGNNAGGSNVDGDCSEVTEGAAAALVDLGGDDVFGGQRRSCGVNGGGYTGSGLIVSTGGDDVFRTGSVATNGGGLDGLGLIVSTTGEDVFDSGSLATNGGGLEGAGAIVSLSGHDVYDGGSLGSNGAGAESGVGVIVDLLGDDVYEAGIIGSNGAGDGHWFGTGVGVIIDPDGTNFYDSHGGNGGGGREGVGLIFDGPGDAQYLTHAFGANGGGQSRGVGMLIDTGGANRFDAAYVGVNGGASSNGVGFLLNLGAATEYTAGIENDPDTAGGFQGVNGGSTGGGIGFLLNAEGGSLFEGVGWGVNGGAVDGGVSLLISGEGDDTFTGRSRGINGGAAGGTALLLNLGGDNHYEGGSGGTNGGARDDGAGALIDLGGGDTYIGDGHGTNGGGRNGGLGLLLDHTGDDRYLADGAGANGGADPLSYALLFDREGTDRYEDSDTDCWDCTIFPKGAVGAQVDQESV